MPNARPRLVYLLEYPIAFGGGVSVLVLELMRGLAAEYSLSLVSPDTAEDLERAGVAPLLEHHLPWHTGRASRARARRLADALLAWEVDLAHFHLGGHYGWGNRRPGTSPIPLLRRAGVRCITTAHLAVSHLHGAIDPLSPRWKKLAATPIAWLGQMSALRWTDAVIAVSKLDQASLQRWYAPYSARIHCIYHSRLPEGLPSPAPLTGRAKTVLHVGHRAPRKGQDVLVRAFATCAPRHAEWRLCLVGPPGDDAFEAELRAIASTAGIAERVEILESRPDVSARLRAAAIYVQPALHEGLPLALQEALYQGCACLSTSVGGVPELIAEGENGLLVPAGEVAPLAAALERLLAQPKLRSRLGAASPKSIRRREMSAPAMVRRHRELYRTLLDAR